MTEQYEDGNARAGPLREIVAVDLTVAIHRCAGCGLTGRVAEVRVYRHAPGLVARCPGCDAVVLRLVRSPDAAFLDLTGMRNLKIALPS